MAGHEPEDEGVQEKPGDNRRDPPGDALRHVILAQGEHFEEEDARDGEEQQKEGRFQREQGRQEKPGVKRRIVPPDLVSGQEGQNNEEETEIEGKRIQMGRREPKRDAKRIRERPRQRTQQRRTQTELVVLAHAFREEERTLCRKF